MVTVRQAAGEKKVTSLSAVRQLLIILCMSESCFTDGVMAGKLYEGMLGFCDVRIPSASGSPLPPDRNWLFLSFSISLSAEPKGLLLMPYYRTIFASKLEFC